MERQDSNNLPPAPTVSALICTADRGDTIVPAVKSILRPDSICCELIIVDQSNDNRTEEAIRPFLSDARLRYIRTPTRGKGIALNIGLKEAIGEIVAITDDDCEVCGDWPACHVRLYRQNPDLVLTYGNVLAANYDPSEGIIPVHHVTLEAPVHTVWGFSRVRGIGANTAMRREPVLRLGGFDPTLGPGGKFGTSVDHDMTLRCLLAGYTVQETKGSNVVHYGLRRWDRASDHVRKAYFGIGACYVKTLLSKRWDGVCALCIDFLRFTLLPAIRRTLTLHRPFGWGQVGSFFRGVLTGLGTPFDRVHKVYLASGSAPAPVPNRRSIGYSRR